MFRHYIIVFSDYNLGKRIAYHIENENPEIFLLEAKKIKAELK